MATGTGSPCGACKFLRRKCATDCVFAPYFCSEQGPARFAAIHKVFGASNVSKLLLQVPVQDRCEAVVTIAYEAQARIRDPVYGCVAHIFALQQQVTCLQAQLMQLKSQNFIDSRYSENHWMGNEVRGSSSNLSHMHSVSPQSSIDSVENNVNDKTMMQELQARDLDDFIYQTCSNKKILSNSDLGELQALAIRMMKN
ncbi:hypothetical protein GIB67_039586 [Kingdonia uniflora]|uniref:LOB domain-containing protein n=1 Tax=Kingdonia uniflora TaxID=39325 RepID=A0A7J7P770_9MAGN|nr:hypothetical protein GIB67_039586 [Kingdonia uniflora]